MEEKVKTIFKALEGVSYTDWKKIEMTVNERFEMETAKQRNKIILGSTDELMNSYRRSF